MASNYIVGSYLVQCHEFFGVVSSIFPQGHKLYVSGWSCFIPEGLFDSV